MEKNHKKAQQYIAAQKRMKKIKGFYFQIAFSVIIIPVMILVNLYLIVPEYHWFWFGIMGISLSLILGWLDVFGYHKMGLNKEWEQKKIKEYMTKN